MDLFGGPAALGGIIMCVALAAWTLGRWQGMALSTDTTCDPAGDAQPLSCDHAAAIKDHRPPPIPCQQAAQADRRGALDVAVSLGELHAEVSAYRRAQQVFAGLASDPLELPAPRGGTLPECRYFGLTGEPNCTMPEAVRRACAEGDACHDTGTPQRIAVQPSAFGSDFTRV